MIPASYLYKDAYRQHWGQDFARISGEEPWELHRDAGHWQQPSLLRTIRDFVVLAFAREVHHSRISRTAASRASESDCPEPAECPALPA